MTAKRLLGLVLTLLVAGQVSATAAESQDLESAKQEYEQSSHNEAARIAYVTKLARIADRLVSDFRQRGERNDELMSVINSELRKHPAPKDVDGKGLTKLLVGKWESPRHIYVFRANGTTGMEGGPMNGHWRIQGNQLIEGDAGGTIILLNQDYFIYSGGHDAVFFHSRVKD